MPAPGEEEVTQVGQLMVPVVPIGPPDRGATVRTLVTVPVVASSMVEK
jgi:hypothetical protein